MRVLAGDEASIHSEESERDGPRRAVLEVSGRRHAVSVEGGVLEACVAWDDWLLVLTTDGEDFEDFLHVHLFDADLRRIDYLRLGAAYSTGALRNLQLVEPDCVRLDFIGGTRWSIRLSRKPLLRLPFSDPKGVSRGLALRRFMSIDGAPLPQET